MLKKIVIFVVFVLYCISGYSQVWTYTPDSDHHNSIVKIECNFEGIGTAYGTGFVIGKKEDRPGGYLGYIMTARHVVADDNVLTDPKIKIFFSNGTTSSNALIQHKVAKKGNMNLQTDCAIVFAWIPDYITPLEICDSAPISGTKVEICGFSRGDVLRHFEGLYGIDGCTKDGDANYAFQSISTWVIPGDSGGAILYNGKVLGIVSGGNQWSPYNIELNPKISTKFTFPCNSPRLSVIKEAAKVVLNK